MVRKRSLKQHLKHYDNLPMQFIENFFSRKKNGKFYYFAEAVLTCIDDLSFASKIGKNVYPSFSIQKWGLMGYTLHGHVFVVYA